MMSGEHAQGPTMVRQDWQGANNMSNRTTSCGRQQQEASVLCTPIPTANQ